MPHDLPLHSGRQADIAREHEGSSVTVLALEGDETFEADGETEKMLLEAIAQGDRGQTTPMRDFLAELRSRE
jgi:hypothetical protein